MFTDKELYNKAEETLKYSYAPYSHYRVAAALLTGNNKVFTGVNIENSAYGASICAERSAVSKAVSDGEKNFIKIAVASDSGAAAPCGTCRQVLYEFGDDIDIIFGPDADNLSVYKIRDLLPQGFRMDTK